MGAYTSDGLHGSADVGFWLNRPGLLPTPLFAVGSPSEERQMEDNRIVVRPVSQPTGEGGPVWLTPQWGVANAVRQYQRQ